MARKPARKKPRTAKSKPARSEQHRVDFNDLPPDRKAEITGRQRADIAKRKHKYRPTIPAVTEHIELHSAEIQILYTKWFDACNEYAVAIDYVARDRLTERREYNLYLQEFDNAIEELSGKARNLHAQYEKLSNGGMSESQFPSKIDARIQSKRSYQLLQQFTLCDQVLRMIQFLTIYGDLPEETSIRDTRKAIEALNKCLSGLRKVKIKCFKRIIELENLVTRKPESMTVEDLETARNRARSQANDPNLSKPKSRRKAKAKIDPAADLNEPLAGQASVPASTSDAPVATQTAAE